MTPALVWFRLDLRLRDNPALQAAAERGGAVIPVFVLDPAAEGAWAPGAASRWWLHHSLESLEASLREKGSRLIVARGDSLQELGRILKETGAGALYWNRRYEPLIVRRDAALEREFGARGIDAQGFNGALLFEPHSVQNKQGRAFQVFTPYWRRCLELPVSPPKALPEGALGVSVSPWPKSLRLAELGLLPRGSWAQGFSDTWRVGEKAAQARLRSFVSKSLAPYGQARERPDLEGTSRLSPHLHFGELGPRQIWARVRELSADTGVFPANAGAEVFLREIGWREFAHHLLFHFPETAEAPLRDSFRAFAWAEDPGDRDLSAWQKGQSGYPIVDAGMRQLWQSGWMHNRVRMIVASFLVKHLRINWTRGAQWFWDTLVDADLPNNTLGWQWSAGCGADAAPYFRIFSPVRQGLKFDPEGAYVRRYVPELSRLPNRYLQAPWEAPPAVLSEAGVRLGETYPRPRVDAAAARAAALRAFSALRRKPDA